MSRLKELLTEYGVDWDATMPRFAYDENLFMKCFGLFMRDENLDKLGEALAARDYEAAFVAAHTLKGVTANMGFAPMYEAVCRIVEPLRAKNADEDYDTLYAAIGVEADKIKALKAQADGEL